MALSFLCAGCPQAERDEAEATVRAALGERVRTEPWAVSLVRVGGTWSVTLDGPGFKALSFVSPSARLGASILERLAPAADPAPIPAPKAATRTMHDRHDCHRCQHAFAVVYELEPDEAQETANVACPYCWQVNQVLVGEAAAYTEAFKAERL
jgi:hypothetical protein